ncbi:hypothetical protein F5B21DRAFT_525892 [Xylaria acuta]|nr:hypothetical protein F5B21DRAFT_525892 [Xylaria acuta]
MGPDPIPIILCGKTLETGERSSISVNPFEYAKDNLPDLLAGRGPKSPSSNNLGTHDYRKAPRAVIFGRAFDPAHVKRALMEWENAGVGSENIVYY